ncbi:hypothetical protein LUZ60_016750 [Juncus effusus]|nr:hypothetical protein LUZ60_016750 [Juncus effusus]
MKDLGGLAHLFVTGFLFYFSSYMVIPAITDVTLQAICPGRDECSLAIYLSGFNQAITGLGALIVTPLVGNLSDKFGRKALLTLPTTVAIVPLVILAYDRSTTYFYAYYVIKILSGMFCEGSMQCLSLAYVADKVGERRRASAFGVFSGISAAGFVFGTLAARFLSTSSTFQVAAAVSALAAIYLRLFLPESNVGIVSSDEESSLCAPLCSDGESSSPRLTVFRKIPSFSDMIDLLTSSLTMSRAAVITFFHSLGESGLQTALMYYLKAQFHFSKDQYANLLLIAGTAGTISQLTLMPFLAPIIGEEKLLTLGLFASCAHVFLYSIAWSYWVPYVSASIVIVSIFVGPSIRSMVSRKVGPTEQGMAQGCLTGISSFASIVAPFAFTPLTAWFLSDESPFNFKGFSIMCAGFCIFIAFTMSISMRTRPAVSAEKVNNLNDTSSTI